MRRRNKRRVCDALSTEGVGTRGRRAGTLPFRRCGPVVRPSRSSRTRMHPTSARARARRRRRQIAGAAAESGARTPLTRLRGALTSARARCAKFFAAGAKRERVSVETVERTVQSTYGRISGAGNERRSATSLTKPGSFISKRHARYAAIAQAPGHGGQRRIGDLSTAQSRIAPDPKRNAEQAFRPKRPKRA